MSNAILIRLKSHTDTGEDEEVELDLDRLAEDATEICDLLENEDCARIEWLTVASAYRRLEMIDQAHEVIKRSLTVPSCSNQKDRARLFAFQSWLYMQQAREAPKTVIHGIRSPMATKRANSQTRRQ